MKIIKEEGAKVQITSKPIVNVVGERVGMIIIGKAKDAQPVKFIDDNDLNFRDYDFQNGEWVRVWLEDGVWEYQEDSEDVETYMSGIYELDGKTVVDYDGCYELPQAVQKAFVDCGFDLDL